MSDLRTPWSVDDDEIIDASGQSVTGAMCTFSDKADAYVDGIVNRVNAYEANEALIKELVEALHVVGMSAGWQYLTMETRALVEAAMAKAEARS